MSLGLGAGLDRVLARPTAFAPWDLSCRGYQHEKVDSRHRARLQGLARSAEKEVAHRREVPRLIMHIHLDAFFAAVEQRDNPRWRGRPVVVGAERANRQYSHLDG